MNRSRASARAGCLLRQDRPASENAGPLPAFLTRLTARLCRDALLLVGGRRQSRRVRSGCKEDGRKGAAKPRRRSCSVGLGADRQPGRSCLSLPTTLARCGQPGCDSPPISRVLSRGTSPLGDHSSRTAVARRLQQPTRMTEPVPALRTEMRAPSLFGLAPGGVCRAALVAHRAVRSCRTVSPLPVRPERRHRRSLLCGTVPDPGQKAETAGYYPAPRSVEPGLSSAGLLLTRPPSDVIAAWPLP